MPRHRIMQMLHARWAEEYCPEKGKTMARNLTMMDGSEAVASVAYRTNEVMTIYPITPSSTMGELADAWAAEGRSNIWGQTPLVQEMQSEGGAAGAVHGSLQAGALTTTFTASQGLLLMLPNMFKIAGELTSTVFHVAARTVAAHALSIFGDHSDIMAVRSAGWAVLFSDSPQQAHDMALIAQAAALRARLPFIHAFDGFRTSHEVQGIETLPDSVLRALLPEELIRAHRARALAPEHPVMRGSAQNPDVYFQAREACSPWYKAAPQIVEDIMQQFAAHTGRSYSPFQYTGHPQAERVAVVMGSAAETLAETVNALVLQGEKVGVLQVHLFRPFSAEHLVRALPGSVEKLAVLDRTKEPGAAGEPLYTDVVTALSEMYSTGELQQMPRITGGRYGLASREFTPAMAAAVLEELKKPSPLNHFTVGITDDVSHSSLSVDESLNLEPQEVTRAVFWGLGADGTVGANKNSIKIIGEDTSLYAQGYFVYDSKKSGSVTTSHLRFGPNPIHSPYLIRSANFAGIHQFGFLERYPVLQNLAPGAVVLLNSPYGPGEVWNQLPSGIQQQLIDKQARLYVIDAYEMAKRNSMGTRINVIMQTCFFALSGVLPRDEAIACIKEAVRKTYGKRGKAVVERNFAAIDNALSGLHAVPLPAAATPGRSMPPVVPAEAPEFVQKFTAEIIAGRGDSLPVSAMPPDGTFPTGTSQWERRCIAQEIPVWNENLCIQCGKCVLVCPHAVIRARVVPAEALQNAPEGFQSAEAHWREHAGERYTLQVSVEDCTGCSLCVEVCPAVNKSITSQKALHMAPVREVKQQGMQHWQFFKSLPEHLPGKGRIHYNTVKNVQLLQPLFEFSGACAGCGETPYIKLITQLFGHRALIANATGCSSIYGGSLPATPYATNRQGCGPAWSNSLFEDNAEFGLGMRLAVDVQTEHARTLVQKLSQHLGAELTAALLQQNVHTEEEIEQRREQVEQLRTLLQPLHTTEARDLLATAGNLIPRSIWIIGGDGWAYDIGYGGLDHVIASGKNVNVLVLDTEVYSNTGGQASKATSRAAVAKFAASGKATAKKDLGRMFMAYRSVYVAQIALGASDAQTLRALREAESYDGPSIIIAYSHCIAHGIDMSKGLWQQKLAADTGYWLLYRYDPRLVEKNMNPLQLDSKAPALPLHQYLYNETRFRSLQQSRPQHAAQLLKAAQEDVDRRWLEYSQMAAALPWQPEIAEEEGESRK